MARKPHLLKARREFSILLDRHLIRGQHPDTPPSRWKPWTNYDFAGVCGVSPNSAANWRNAASPMPPADIVPVLDVLFGDKPDFAGHRRALKEAWERAQGLIAPEPPESEADWEIQERSDPNDFAVVILHQPAPANRPGTYHLTATIRFGTVKGSDRDRAVIVGVRAAYVDIRASGYQHAQNSLIGERTPHALITPGAHGITIASGGPDIPLRGNPIGEDHLVTIEPGPPGNGIVSVSIAVDTTDFTVAFAPGPDAPEASESAKPNRAAVLGALLGKGTPRDSERRLVLASAKLRRKSAQ